MSKTRIRLWLLVLIVAAVVAGIIYYIYFLEKDTTVTEGTLVENVSENMEEQRGEGNFIYQNRS